jgi:hypothetical protein
VHDEPSKPPARDPRLWVGIANMILNVAKIVLDIAMK